VRQARTSGRSWIAGLRPVTNIATSVLRRLSRPRGPLAMGGISLLRTFLQAPQRFVVARRFGRLVTYVQQLTPDNWSQCPGINVTRHG
jgi:hypothetical protein